MNINKIKPIPVLETIRQGKIGGGESHVYSLCTSIDQDRYKPIVLSFTDGPMVEMLREKGVKTYVIHNTKPFNYFISGKVNEIIKNEEIQLIHAHGTRATSNSFWSASKHKIPIIYTVHAWSFHPALSSIKMKLRVMSEKYLTRKVQHTICVSNANQKEGIERFKLKNSSVIFNGVDIDKFSSEQEFNDIRNELNIPAGKTLFGYIVRLTKQKDPITFLDAIRKIVQVTTDVHFLIVGGGDMKNEVYERIASYGLSDFITLQDFRSDIPSVLSSIDVYVLPSLWEGLPIGIIEAMAMAKPCIVSDIPPNKELIESNINGLLVPVMNSDKLCEAMLRLHRNSDLRIVMGQNSYKKCLDDFNLQSMVKKIEMTYSNLLNS